jgi:putative membrane protein
MDRFDAGYFDKVTTLVEQVETKTAAEVVVAIYPRSGSYRDIKYLCGMLLAFAWLLFVVLNPWLVTPPFMVPIETAFAFGIGAIVAARLPSVVRLFTTEKRHDDQVRAIANTLFIDDGIGNTRSRTGILIFLSQLERHVEIIPDIGIVENVKPDAWAACLFELKNSAAADDPAQALLDAVRHLGVVLADGLPATDDNPDEIPNRARVLQ